MMKQTLSLSVCLGAALVTFVACGGDDTTDDPMTMGTNDGGTGGGGEDKLPILSVGSIQNPTERDADFSCLEGYPAPTSTLALSQFNLQIKDFEDDFVVPEVQVWVFADNVIDETCEAPECVEATTDANGIVSVMGHAGGYYAYRVFPKAGATSAETVTGSVQFNEVAPAPGGMNDGISVSAKTLDLIPNVLGFGRTAGTGMIAGSLSDCMGADVRGAIARVYDANGTEIMEGMRQEEPHYRYFDGDSFPSATEKHSNVDGLYAVANIPVDGASSEVTVELWGRRDGDDEPVLLARERGRIFPDTVTALNLNPLPMQ